MNLKVYRIKELPEYSYLAVFVLEKSFAEETVDINAFVCSNDVLCRDSASCIPGQAIGRYIPTGSTPSPPTVVEVSPEYVLSEYTVYSSRVLESIASLADLDEYSTDPGTDAFGLYRANTVAVMFNTESLMDLTINLVKKDLLSYVKSVQNVSLDVEVITHSKTTDDDSRDYLFNT